MDGFDSEIFMYELLFAYVFRMLFIHKYLWICWKSSEKNEERWIVDLSMNSQLDIRQHVSCVDVCVRVSVRHQN